MASMNRITWWQWVPLPWRKWRVVVNVDAGDEVPDRLPHRGVALVGPIVWPTWAAFDCLCGRGHRIMINLDPSRQPWWRVESRKPLSIEPSIHDITPSRRCHFALRRGRIAWSVDAGEGIEL